MLDDVSLPGDVFGVVASTTRRDICRPTGGQEWVEIKYSIHPIITMPTITMMLLVSMECGETGRIGWTGKIVDKDVKFCCRRKSHMTNRLSAATIAQNAAKFGRCRQLIDTTDLLMPPRAAAKGEVIIMQKRRSGSSKERKEGENA